jgi:hypothetical protein
MEAVKELVLARIHLRAIIPLLEDISEFDTTVEQVIKEWNMPIQFQLPGGEAATTLSFRQGKIIALRDKINASRITLTFSNAETLNAIFQGRSKKSPRPNLTGLFHIKKLLQVDSLLKRIEYYMKPDKELLEDDKIFEQCVTLTLNALVFGVKEIGEHDPEMKPLAKCLPDGVVEIRVIAGPAVHLTVNNGLFTPAKGRTEKPNAYLEIADMQTAWAMVQGNLDQYAAIGSGKIKIRGLIPLIDGINPIIDRLSLYMAD